MKTNRAGFSYKNLNPRAIAQGIYSGPDFPPPLRAGTQFNNYGKLVGHLSTEVLKLHSGSPGRIKVGITGRTNAGKSTLARKLKENLSAMGKHVVHFSEDFALHAWETTIAWDQTQRPKFIDPWKYWFRWHKVEAFFAAFDNPEIHSVTASELFNKEDNGKLTLSITETLRNDSILLYDGVFIYDPAHYPDFDFSVFVYVKFIEAIQRSIRKGKPPNSVQDLYERCFIPSQIGYGEALKPEHKASVVVDMNDFEKPKTLIYSP